MTWPERSTSFPSFLGATVPINFKDFADAGHNATFPRIVVIGDENSGKSSLLQRVAGQNVFPVSEKFCTRMPVVLSLKSGDDSGTIKMHALHGDKVLETQSVDARDAHSVSDKVKEAIDALNNTVNKERDVPFGDRSVLSDHSIKIEMSRPDFPDIDFVDLPGLVTDAGARDATAKLTESFLGDNNAILLWVVSDFSDSLRVNLTLGLLQTAVAGQRAIQDRVIVALTKTDKSINDENAGGRRVKERLSDLRTTFGFSPAAVIPVISRIGTAGFKPLSGSLLLQTEEQLLNEMGISSPRGLNGLLFKVAEIAERITKTVWIPSVIDLMEKEMAVIRTTLDGFGLPPDKLSVEEVLSSLAFAIWNCKADYSLVTPVEGYWPFDAPAILKPEVCKYMDFTNRKYSGLGGCEKACVDAIWDRNIRICRNTIIKRSKEMVADIIQIAIASDSCAVGQVAHKFLRRMDFSFITESFEPSVPKYYNPADKYKFESNQNSVDSCFKMHLSECLCKWIVLPLIKTISKKNTDVAPKIKETPSASSEREMAVTQLNKKKDLVKRLKHWSNFETKKLPKGVVDGMLPKLITRYPKRTH